MGDFTLEMAKYSLLEVVEKVEIIMNEMKCVETVCADGSKFAEVLHEWRLRLKRATFEAREKSQTAQE